MRKKIFASSRHQAAAAASRIKRARSHQISVRNVGCGLKRISIRRLGGIADRLAQQQNKR